MVVAIVATLKAGGAYLPLDPDYPAQRLAFMLEDAGARVVVTDAACRGSLAVGPATVLDLDRERDAIAALDTAPPHVAVEPEHLAYVIYTSGSTGRPKGVMVPHRAICNHMQWLVSRFALTARDAVLQKTPVSFDASVWEIFAPLVTGGRLVLARQGAHRDSAHLVRVMAAHGVTVLQLVPSQLRLVLEEPALAACDALRLVFSGGEPLTGDLCARFRQRLDAELHNLYGPTEAAIDATSWPCHALGPGDRVPIGKPIANLQAHVLDRYGNLVPRGVPGILHLGGAGLARGYRGQPQLTAERFVPDPFAAQPGARLYCTGDRVRRLRDGSLEFLGRIDQQVKLRGYRIEPAEVARVLETHPGVREAVAGVRTGEDGEPRLGAWVVPAAQPPCAIAALRAHLRGLLPDYMMPAWLAMLPELPRTPHGKIDWQALPAAAPEAPAPRAAPLSSAQSLERRVAAVWAEVLGVAEVGPDDNFFDLGGHSLLMVQVQHGLRAALDVEVALLDLFRYPSVRLLSVHLAGSTAAVPHAPVPRPAAPPAGNPAPQRPSMQARPIFRRPPP
jgi:amino acid adenylation domain-containing protein